MKPIRTIIADDEPLARENLMLRLRNLADCEFVAACGGGRETLRAIDEHQPDVLFLDIQMPDLNGFEVVDRIPADQMPIIVFVTAYDQYALDAFKVHALDYLLKPFSAERFEMAWGHAREQVLRLRQDQNRPHPRRPLGGQDQRPNLVPEGRRHRLDRSQGRLRQGPLRPAILFVAPDPERFGQLPGGQRIFADQPVGDREPGPCLRAGALE